MPPREVFLSHASQDRALAERIGETLRVHGVTTFQGPEHILGAQQWQDEILLALQRCDWFVVLLSPDAVQSMWVRREVAYALNRREFENRIVPLLGRSCDLGPLGWLTLIQMIDFQADFSEGSPDNCYASEAFATHLGLGVAARSPTDLTGCEQVPRVAWPRGGAGDIMSSPPGANWDRPDRLKRRWRVVVGQSATLKS